MIGRGRRRQRKRTPFQMKSTRAVHLSKAVRGTIDIGVTARTVLASSQVLNIYGPDWSLIPDRASLSLIFKYYRLNAMYMQWDWPFNDVSAGKTGTSTLDTVDRGRIYIIPDPKNIIDPNTITENALLEMGSDVRRIEVKNLKNARLKFKTPIHNLYPGALITGAIVGLNYNNRSKQWHDVTASNINYFWGHIIHFVDGTYAAAMKCQYQLKYYFSVRGNK